jgi:hypothetical protein
VRSAGADGSARARPGLARDGAVRVRSETPSKGQRGGPQPAAVLPIVSLSETIAAIACSYQAARTASIRAILPRHAPLQPSP